MAGLGWGNHFLSLRDFLLLRLARSTQCITVVMVRGKFFQPCFNMGNSCLAGKSLIGDGMESQLWNLALPIYCLCLRIRFNYSQHLRAHKGVAGMGRLDLSISLAMSRYLFYVAISCSHVALLRCTCLICPFCCHPARPPWEITGGSDISLEFLGLELVMEGTLDNEGGQLFLKVLQKWALNSKGRCVNCFSMKVSRNQPHTLCSEQ